jgi:hypothetical protein
MGAYPFFCRNAGLGLPFLPSLRAENHKGLIGPIIRHGLQAKIGRAL